jgi:hypothetical protein
MRIERALEKYVLQVEGNGRSKHTVAQARRHLCLFETWLEAEGASTELSAIDHELVALFLSSDTVTKRSDNDARVPFTRRPFRQE